MERKHGKKTEPEEGKKEFEFENLNPCAAYEVRLEPYNNLQERTFTVGPYFDNPTLFDPLIDDENNKYAKSLCTMTKGGVILKDVKAAKHFCIVISSF